MRGEPGDEENSWRSLFEDVRRGCELAHLELDRGGWSLVMQRDLNAFWDIWLTTLGWIRGYSGDGSGGRDVGGCGIWESFFEGGSRCGPHALVSLVIAEAPGGDIATGFFFKVPKGSSDSVLKRLLAVAGNSTFKHV